ncbi:MAG: bacteriorhodopsin [Thermoleophilia bacterium]|nr:bacteriorhodopsin [Thermoleophilia bacterium]
MELTSTQETILWAGTIGMALGAIIIAAIGFRLPKAERHHVTASFFVCAIAAVAYYAMATGLGTITVNGNEIFFARYADWVLTTPLLLLGLITVGIAAVAGGEAGRERAGLIGFVIGADILMIVTGFVAALDNDDDKYVWYAISCVFFLLVLWAVYGPVKEYVSSAMKPLYVRLLTILTVLWLIYPVLWLLGTEGTGTLDLTGEIAVFAVIDVIAKVGFGILLVTGVGKAAKHVA